MWTWNFRSDCVPETERPLRAAPVPAASPAGKARGAAVIGGERVECGASGRTGENDVTAA